MKKPWIVTYKFHDRTELIVNRFRTRAEARACKAEYRGNKYLAGLGVHKMYFEKQLHWTDGVRSVWLPRS